MSSAAELTAQIRSCEKRIELADALDRLSHNRDFKLLEERIFKEEVQSLMRSLSMQDANSVEFHNIVRRMDAISFIGELISVIKSSAEPAREDVRQARRYLGDNFKD